MTSAVSISGIPVTRQKTKITKNMTTRSLLSGKKIRKNGPSRLFCSGQLFSTCFTPCVLKEF